jgi:hypothetical protein
MTFGPWSFRLNWTRYNRLSLEDGPNLTFHGHLDHGQLDQEKSRLDYGPLDHGPKWSSFLSRVLYNQSDCFGAKTSYKTR